MPLKALPSIFLATNVPKEKAESLELIWRPSHRLKSVLHSSSSGCCRASTNPNLTPKGPSTVNPFNHLPASPPFPHLLTVPHVSSPPALTLASEMQSVLSTVFLQSTQANNKNNPALPALPVQWQRSLLQFVQQQRCNSTIAQKQLHFTAEQQLPAQLKNQLLNLLLHCLPIPEVWLFLTHSAPRDSQPAPTQSPPIPKTRENPTHLLLSPVSLFKFCLQIPNAVPSTGVLLFQEV